MFTVLLLTGCGIKIPDVLDTEEAVAKNVLSSNGFIPVVEYVYHDDTAEGLVVGVSPAVGESADKNSKVTIYVSKGPSIVFSKDSTIHWYHVSSDGEDEWNFYSPYIEEGILKIECHDVKFYKSIEWKDNNGEGTLFGNASINDTFDKTVPIRAKYEKQKFSAKEAQNFTLEIPLSDLNVQKPTNLYIELYAKVAGKEKDISINFTMTW